ncbi:MAG TPA: choice-of-anchor D domain-containing protein, partial [Pyrinomonadaceae bacterium]|nr:choice-of-anchor D domain-containing protein [Pyrinomonadaceae bacterium]
SGTANLTVSNPIITGTNPLDFTVSVNPVSPVGPGGSTTFKVKFDPTAAGVRTATVTIDNNDLNENPYDFAIQGTGVQTFTGIVNVGTGQTYTSLTNVDGIFSAFDTGIVSGDVTINITSDLTAETGEFGLRTLTESGVGNYRVLIKPSAAGRIISGSFDGRLVRIDGADRVTIDGWSGSTIGSAAGGPATRDMTIINTAASGTPSVLSILNTHTNPSQDNTFQNLNVQGTAGTQAGIVIGGTGAGTDNDNGHILNCLIKSADFGILTSGESTANPNIGTRIEQNVLNGTGTDRIRFIGISAQNESGIQIIGNNIGNINAGSATGVVIGIGVGVLDESQFNINSTVTGGVVGALISANKIAGVNSDSTFSAGGIAVAGGSGASNMLVNNMISGVKSAATSPDVVAGIFIAGTTGSSPKLYNNSISMTGDRGNRSLSPSFGVAIAGSDPVVELKNNIFYTTQTAIGGGPDALSFAIGTNSSTFANLDSNYNAFFSSGLQDGGFRTGGLIAGSTDYPNLAAWRTAVNDDANSLEVNPTFVDPLLDPHLQLGSPVSNAGTPIASVTRDIDGEPRSLTTPDIGADEIVGTPDISVLGPNLSPVIDDVSTVDLGTEMVGVPGTAKTFLVRNVGTDPLTVNTTISVTGANAADFVVNSAGMTPTVGIGSSTSFTITFTPSGTGTRTAAISIANNDPDENPFNFALTGTGVITYTIAYNGNGNTGGTPPIDTSSPYVAGSTVTVLGNTGNLVKTNFLFNGWNT